MITLYHNPHCSKSCAVLALIRQAGIEPNIVEYLNTPLCAETIAQLIQASGISVQAALRQDVAEYAAHIAGRNLSDEAIIQLMATYPKLLNRPFASGEKGTKFCRPPELVLSLL